MADNKRFYWIKLRDSFLTSDAVDFLMGQKNGSEYVVLYQMLCLKTANTKGVLAREIGEIIIPYNAEKIQRDCKYFSIDTVHIALELYKKLGLIYEQADGFLKIADFEKIVGSETEWAEKKRLYRGNKKDNVLEMSKTNSRTKSDKRLEIETRASVEVSNLNTSTPTKEEYKCISAHDVRVDTHTHEDDANSDIPLNQDNPPFIASPALGDGQKQGAEDENKKRSAPKKLTDAEINTFFDTTWEMYPRKINKVQALKTYGYKLKGLSEEDGRITANKIFAMLKNQIKAWAAEGEHGREIEYMPHFSTWLNANFADADGKLRCR